jgi:hypothetical protein
MENKFEIRTYGFNELAQLYFPQSIPKSASQTFSRWIHSNPKLVKSLTALQWKKHRKYFTPKQVKVLIDYFDPP